MNDAADISMGKLREFRHRKIGLALSGGSVRGIAHIGVIKALTEAGIRPSIVVGTSVGSLVGAAFAAGMNWQEILQMARDVFWPHLLNGRRLDASCAMRVIRRSVSLGGMRLEDGGTSCVLPSEICRRMGADVVIASDVWEFSALLRGVGVGPAHVHARRVYPRQYMNAVSNTDLLVHTDVPLIGYLPGKRSVDRLFAAGEIAANKAEFIRAF